MKIKGITNPRLFFERVGQCGGSVELVTVEGDRLNMKSTLCQYIALTQMFQDARIENVELVTEEPGDMESLREFLE